MQSRRTMSFYSITALFFIFLQSIAPASLMANTLSSGVEAFVTPEQAIDGHEAEHDHHDEAPEDQAETSIDSLMDDGGLEAAQPGKPEEARPGGGGAATLKLSKIKSSGTTATSTQISWTTNLAANSTVQYGTTSSYGLSVSDASMVKNHILTLTNLNPETLYYYRVLSTDANGVEKISADYTFTTLTADVTAPVISNVNTSNTSQNQTTVTWTTNEPADTQIEYGTTTAYGQFTTLNSSLVTSHSQTLTGLSANTLYHYRVLSQDAAGNLTVSGDFTFQTSQVNTGGSPASIFLNFMGAYIPQWGNYSNVVMNAFTGAGSVITQTLAAMIEKYSIFNLNVTTTDPYASDGDYVNDTAEEANARYAYYSQNRILEVSIGTSSSQSQICPGGCGGVAYVNSFTSSIVNSVLVFTNSLSNVARYIWEAAAHEAGHGFGLQHQSAYNGNQLVDAYSRGNGIVSPIMGVSYYSSRGGQWWYGTTSSSTTFQDDIAVVSRIANGFGMRPDEAGDDPDSAAAFDDVFGTSFSTNGVITSLQDEDYYEFTTTEEGNVSFTGSIATYGGMLDMVLEIRDASNNLITTASTSSLGESILNYSLLAGKYYLVVRSQGAYYGDLGQYSINGTVPIGTTTTPGPNAPAGGASSSEGSEGDGLSASQALNALRLDISGVPFDARDSFFYQTRIKIKKSGRFYRPLTFTRNSEPLLKKKSVSSPKSYSDETHFVEPSQSMTQFTPAANETTILRQEITDVLADLFEPKTPEASAPDIELGQIPQIRASFSDEKSPWTKLFDKKEFAPIMGVAGNMALWVANLLQNDARLKQR